MYLVFGELFLVECVVLADLVGVHLILQYEYVQKPTQQTGHPDSKSRGQQKSTNCSYSYCRLFEVFFFNMLIYIIYLYHYLNVHIYIYISLDIFDIFATD